MALTPGTSLGNYEILAMLGAGGMGEVYRARDIRLGREVAIKVLLDAFAADPERLARFEREARMVASLNHPNIVVLYAIEEHAGARFLAMELVEGESLDRHVVAGGVPLARILDLAIPLVDALVAAHAKDVVHRDLKPGNLMVAGDGRLKVLDFGLAKLAAPAAESVITRDMTREASLSRDGRVVGTVPYMAPEQLCGQPVDARTDLFALGIILYELATGARPFAGRSAMEISSSILRDAPPALRSIRPDLPAGLEQMISRCLAKASADRYQTARDVLDALRAIRGQGAATQAPAAARSTPSNHASIGVLPFANRSGDPDDEYFSDGLADELVNVLVKIRGLRVAARASSFRFKGRDATIGEVGQALNVATVLDGSVRKARDRMRVSVQLVSVADGYHLWSETYDRTIDDVLAVQDDIAHSVVTELRQTLLGEKADATAGQRAKDEVAAAVKGRVADPEAYDLYLRGRYLMSSSDDGPSRAQEMFRRAIERAPSFALPYAGLGDAYVLQSWRSSRDQAETVPKARAALAKALELDGQCSEALVLSGQLKLFFDWDWNRAGEDFRKAIELSASSDLAHREYSSFLSIVGREEEGIAEARKAQALDPLSVNASHELGFQLLACGRLEEAVSEFRKAIDLNPNWIWGNSKLGMTYGFMGEADKAMACVRRSDELLAKAAGSPLTQAWLATVEHLAGDATRVHRTLARLADEAQQAYVDPVAMTWLHLARDDHDAAFAALDQGYELRSPTMAWVQMCRRFMWRGIADDPRYEALIERMGFAEAGG